LRLIVHAILQTLETKPRVQIGLLRTTD
jgi:hypothetical protein